jgi:metal transporter CNNM
MDYIIVIVLVLFSGLFSGLNLGLLSIDKSELERKIKLGDNQARKVYSVRKNGNLLLCTLLLGNVAVNAAIALYLGNIASGVVAGVVATGLILAFGEIIPQASFTRHAMKFGAKTAWLVKILIILMYPVCAPIGWVLDKMLGEELPTVYSRKELISIIEEHEDMDKLDSDEERIVKGALTFSDKKVSEIMTPRKKVFGLNYDMILDSALIRAIKKRGHTRIPVFGKSPKNITGVLYVKDLIGLDDKLKVGKIAHEHKILWVSQDLKLDELLDKFVDSKLHIAIIHNRQREFVGLATLEDVVEEVLKIEIVDESDSNK